MNYSPKAQATVKLQKNGNSSLTNTIQGSLEPQLNSSLKDRSYLYNELNQVNLNF